MRECSFTLELFCAHWHRVKASLFLFYFIKIYHFEFRKSKSDKKKIKLMMLFLHFLTFSFANELNGTIMWPRWPKQVNLEF